jgi:hypothetical protein
MFKLRQLIEPYHKYHVQSAAALSTVLRTTMLSYGNMRFSNTGQTAASQPIIMKFCMIDDVG